MKLPLKKIAEKLISANFEESMNLARLFLKMCTNVPILILFRSLIDRPVMTSRLPAMGFPKAERWMRFCYGF
jgi:hypothetical protein